MKQKILESIIIILLLITTGCSLFKDNNKDNQIEKKSDVTMTKINVTINNKKYILTLENSKTVDEFIELLPQEYIMNDLNENEKYIYLDHSLTTNSYNPKHIEKGDVMLFGDNCLVLFYKSFETNYSYTRIGHIDNLDDLDNTNIKVIFE